MASSSTTQQPVSVGPFGGRGGRSFDDGTFTGIRKITIFSGEVVDSISIDYENDDNSVTTTFHGGEGGSKTTIILDYPHEYLISAQGTICRYGSNVVVGSLTLQSNKKTYGTFGLKTGEKFSFPSTGGKIIGFHGRSGQFLDAIGVYFEPTTPNSPSSEISPLLRDSDSNTRNPGTQFIQMASSSTTQQPVSVGPFGGQGGVSFDDGTFKGIRKITIGSGDVIDFISIDYDNNDDTVTNKYHGGHHVFTNTIILDYPHEYLVSARGTIRRYYSKVVVGSLKLQSNKKTYGPFGPKTGEKFSFPSTGGKIIGFHGRSGGYLDAIGVYFEPTTPNSPSSEISPLLRDSDSNSIPLVRTILYYLVSIITIGIELTLTYRGDDGKKANSGSIIMSCVLFACSVGIAITTAWSYLISRKKVKSQYDYESVLNILDLITVSGLLIDNSIGVMYLLTQGKIKLLRIPASMIAATIYLLFVRRPVQVFNCFFQNKHGHLIPITLSSANSTERIFVDVNESSHILPQASTSTASTIFQPFRRLRRRFAHIESRGGSSNRLPL